MDQENKVVFRNALNGYNKNDVNEYITELAKEFARRKEDFESESVRLQNALKSETEEKEALAEKFKKLSAEHEILTVAKKKAENDLEKIGGNAKANEQTNEELKAELARVKTELENATATLTTQRDAAAKQKKNAEALAAELTTLKNKFGEKNAEMDSLKKALSEAEQVSVERYAQLTKQNAIAEKCEAELHAVKAELASKDAELVSIRNELLDAAEKASSNSGNEVIIEEIKSAVSRMITEFDSRFGTLDDQLTNLAAKPVEEAKAETPKEPVKEKLHSDLDKKIDAFFA